MKNLDLLKQCGAGIWLARKKLEKKPKQHHVVFRLNRKKWQTHAFVAEKKRKQWFTGQENINKEKRMQRYRWHSFFSFKNGIRMCGENATPSILKEYDRSKTPLRRSEKNMSDRKCSSVDLKRICPIENAAPSIRK